MKHELLRTVGELTRLRSEWDVLLANGCSNSIFMTHQWLESWLEALNGEPQHLLVACVRDDDGRLIGLAPHHVTKYRLLETLSYRVLRPLGDSNCGAEYQSWLSVSGDEARVFARLAEALAGARAEWDLIWLPRLGAWSGVYKHLLTAMEGAGLVVNSRPSTFSAIPLPDTFDAYLGRMSSNRRQQVRRMMRRILGQSGVEVRRIRTADELESALPALFDLHGKRWRAAGQEGVFVRRPRERAFYERFAPRALENGWLAMYVLYAAGEPVATQLGYVYNSVFMQLQEGFDPDYSAHAGNVLRACVIEDCISAGLREYDFLGGITEHKRRWLAEERHGADVLAAAPRVVTAPIMRVGIWPTGAYLRPCAPAV